MMIDDQRKESSLSKNGFNLKAFSNDIIMVTAGQFLIVFFGFAQTLILPKYMPIEDYGYLQLFLLYGSFVGLLHFGFVDGILVRWAGKKLEEIGPEIKMATVFLCIEQIALIIPMLLFSYLFFDGMLRWIVLEVLVYGFIINISSFFIFTAQAIKDFKSITYINVFKNFLFLLFIMITYIYSALNYRIVVCITLISSLLALIAYALPFRPYIFENKEFKNSLLWSYGITNINIGFYFLVGYYLSLASFTFDRFLSSSIFSIDQFAIYSFAVTLSAVFNVFIGSIAQALFPHLCTTNNQLQKGAYKLIRTTIIISWAIFLAVIYFPIAMLIEFYLPQYVESIPLIKIMLCTICFASLIQILQVTYFKICRKQRLYFILSLISIIILIIINIIFLRLENSLIGIAIATFIGFMIWYTINEITLNSEDLDIKSFNDLKLIIGYICAFWLPIFITNDIIYQQLIYILILIPITLIALNFYDIKIRNIIKLSRFLGQIRCYERRKEEK